MASSTTWTPESAPICSALRTASTAFSGPTVSAVTVMSSPSRFSRNCRACSTAYSSSSDSRPSTPTRSTVLSSSNLRSAVASGTYFTQTTMFMVVWPRGPSCALGCGYEVTGRSAATGMAIRVRSLTVALSRSHPDGVPVHAGSGLDDAVEDASDDEPGDRREPPVEERVLDLGPLPAELFDPVLAREHVEVHPGRGAQDGVDELVGPVRVQGDQQRSGREHQGRERARQPHQLGERRPDLRCHVGRLPSQSGSVGAQRPTKVALPGPFSTNEVIPRVRSSVAKIAANCCRSISRAVSRSVSLPRSMHSLAARIARAAAPLNCEA